MFGDKEIVLLVIAFLIIISIIYNCKKNEEFKNMLKVHEGFKNSNSGNDSQNFTKGILDYDIIYCNQLIPKKNNNLYVDTNTPKFNNSNNSNRNNKLDNLTSCFVDNLNNDVKLRKRGFIVVDLGKNKLVKVLQIKGLKEFRVDYCLEDKNNELKKIKNYKPVIYGKLDDINKLSVFKLQLENNKPLIARYLKITNLNEDTEYSSSLKLELYGDLNFKYDKILKHKFDKVEPVNLYNNKITFTKQEINNVHSDKNVIELQLEKEKLVNGISLKSNIPKFKLSLSDTNNGQNINFLPENDNHYFIGGVSGIKDSHIFLAKPQRLSQIKLLPFLNEDSDDKNYVVKDIKFLTSSNNQINQVNQVNNNIGVNNDNYVE